MGGMAEELTRQEATRLLQWWLDAGVDTAISEEPRKWLKAAAPRSNPVAVELAPPSPAELPADFEGFRRWLETSHGLPLDRGGGRRILPHGLPGAKIMLLSDAPAREDAADGKPIGGEAWLLATRMLAAIGMNPDDAYSASLACFHTPGARLSDADLAQCAEIARHHVALVKPQTPSAVRRCAGPCPAWRRVPQRARPGASHRRGADRRDVPPALAATAAGGQGPRLARPVAVDGRRVMLSLFALLLTAQQDPLCSTRNRADGGAARTGADRVAGAGPGARANTGSAIRPARSAAAARPAPIYAPVPQPAVPLVPVFVPTDWQRGLSGHPRRQLGRSGGGHRDTSHQRPDAGREGGAVHRT